MKSDNQQFQSAEVYEVMDRASGKPVPEPILGDRLLRLAYSRPLRHLCQIGLFGNDLISRLMGWYCDRRISARKIEKAIVSLHIDMDDYVQPPGGFRTFNDFFCRRLKPGVRPFDAAPDILISPADSRLLAFQNLEATKGFPVKDSVFTLEGLFRNRQAAEDFQEAAIFIFRLCPADYHRFHFPANGRIEQSWTVTGKLNSVNPMVLALGFDVFSENRRQISILELEEFGTAAFVEVGAFGVGGIVQTHTENTFSKMDEKGYFRFGASTLVLAIRSERIVIDPDLLQNTAQGKETLIKAGDRLGWKPQ